ncbi:hypothetical protein RHSIM_RhsimUnG0244100 [Rhododendron simsii]|uniref:Uncharacterized protein n=1 Tax=Rhododendron simsii TaxID=118357 RepID=A0A834FTC6_RHOSS|nr:hypothetical protein RHSIM_RhsimUnG0244100 [Rhododendron simsii]
MANNSCKDLPDECWELIFKRLHQSHLESPSLSCKRFLSITNTLRTHLKILDPTLIIPLSKRFPRLDSIDLGSLRNGQLHHVIIDIATSGLNLKTLDLSESDRLPLESLKVLGSRMKNLRVFKVSSIIVGNHWRWQYGRSAVVRAIERATPNSFLPNVLCEDSIRWLLSPSGIFSIKTAWNAFRFSAPEVDWHKGVWFKHHVPRWAIVQWLCILGRLATRDRLHGWGVIDSDSMPCLEDLDISEPINRFEAAVTDSGIEVLSSKLKGLRKIDVSGNHYITDKSLLALSTNCVYLAEIFVLDCWSVTSYGIAFVMRNSSNLSSLLVSQLTRIESALFDDLVCCARNLSALGIFDSLVPDEFLHFIVKAGIPLKRLSLARSLHQSFTFSGILLFLNKYQSLERLCIAGTDFLTDENISDLSQCLPALVLIDLDLCNNLTESTLFTLAKNCTLLEDISMDGADVGGGGGGNRASGIAKNPRIKSLNLVKNRNLTDECLAKLALVCPSLEVLDVSSCKGITDNGIADFLKRESKIRKLWINKCQAIKNIGNGFELSELVVLGAARSGINDDGLVVIGNTCRGLLKLNLDGCLGVTTIGLKEILTNCKRLREINLTGCLNVSTETADWLVSSRPSLRKIILPHSSLPSGSQRELLLRNGCLDDHFSQRCSREDSMGMDGEDDDEVEGELENNRFDLTRKGPSEEDAGPYSFLYVSKLGYEVLVA